jgi:hypothetical protein
MVDISGAALKLAMTADPTAAVPNLGECRNISHDPEIVKEVLTIVTLEAEGVQLGVVMQAIPTTVTASKV